MPTTKKKPLRKKTALQRINHGMDAAMKIGLPKDAAIFTMICVEIQILENRIAALEKKS